MIVVNVRHTNLPRTKITYIGRPSPFGNPFKMRDQSDIERKRVVEAYEESVRKSPRMMALIKQLPEDIVLGCFCAPKLCHGDVIVKLWREMHDAP